ncbi:hypothetical protein [Shewanella waksmanii]|uniref:hypothetical protein n=1 Tax=Shewanella waksmanii TaxID=213783 RepID=UPI000491639F|nr:hypothetical protein [Shewanella waksmanii]
MYNTSQDPVWFGELRTPRGNTVLVHDKQFPEASQGRVYFYNTTRDAIIEYAEDIVSANLHDLDGAELEAAQAEYGLAWQAAREAFMQKHEGWVEATQSKPVAKKAKPVVEEPVAQDSDEPELEVDSIDDDFDDSWSNDDD